VSAGAPRHTDVPVRDFEAGITGGEPLVDLIDERPVYLVVFSTADDRMARLRAGEAYARICVEAERLGLASSAMTQAVDLPAVRERFRMLMNWPDHPQMVLRLGHPQPGPTPRPTGRRPLTAVLSFEE
jgi:nitroreductase